MLQPSFAARRAPAFSLTCDMPSVTSRATLLMDYYCLQFQGPPGLNCCYRTGWWRKSNQPKIGTNVDAAPNCRCPDS